MTTQSQVEEQVIAEWLSLEGYFVETNIGLSAHERGGRAEVDIVAVKVTDETLTIRHIEVGGLGGKFEKNLDMVRNKFEKKKREDITEYVKERLSLPDKFEVDYTFEYAFTYATRKQELIDTLRREGIKVTSFDNILLDEIHPSIIKWKKKETKSSRISGTNWKAIQIPRKYRTLFIIDKMITLLEK